MSAKARTVWRCQNCGAQSSRWIGRCNDCGEFGTFVEEQEQPSVDDRRAARASVVTLGSEAAGASEASRRLTGIAELDRVLGGGLVDGSLVLLGGEPGIGKSTLLLQAAEAIGSSGTDVLYVCGEESPQQVGLRAKRLGALSDRVSLLPEIDVTSVEAAVRERKPGVLVVDSIQTAFDPELSGAPGSVGQVRACTARLMRVAKDLGVTTLMVGHVTKDGAIAGPRVLEHMVDAVLYFEGDRDHAFRIVRAVKNRFGSASEIGIFEMNERGLVGVGSPSVALLAERAAAVAGSSVMAAMEGTRPLLVEIQALVTPELPAVAAPPRNRHRYRTAPPGDRGPRAPGRSVVRRAGRLRLRRRRHPHRRAGGRPAARAWRSPRHSRTSRCRSMRPHSASWGSRGRCAPWRRPAPASGSR